MSQAGMTYLQILASLTTNPARKFGYSDRTGRIEKGMEADLAVLSADPAHDPAAFSKVRYTIRNGKIIYRARGRTTKSPTRIRFVFFLIVILAASGRIWASDLALIGAKVYPSPTEPPIEKGSIVIHNGRILAVGPNSTIKVPPSATTIDCKGLVITAGFWNSHVHIFTPGLLHVHESSAQELDQLLDTMFNRWGFTTVFDLSSVLDNTLALRRRIEGGELRGPRILTVGEPIWTIEPIYIRDFLKSQSINIVKTETRKQAETLVRDHVAKGANGIKLFTGSYQGNGKVAILPLAITQAAVREAHRHSYRVRPSESSAVHIQLPQKQCLFRVSLVRNSTLPAWMRYSFHECSSSMRRGGVRFCMDSGPLGNER